MVHKNKKIEYFKFSKAPPLKQPSWQVIVKNFISLNKAALIVVIALAIVMTIFEPLYTLAILIIIAVILFRTSAITGFFADLNAKQQINERIHQRKHFAKINNLAYEDSVSYESTIQISDTDNIAKNYLSGEIGGITFWTADSRYDYEVVDGVEIFHKSTVTTLFLDTEVPNFQIIKRQTLDNLDILNLDYLFSNNFKLAEQFDKKYIFRMPDGYGVDAYYIFTPELLELLLQYDPWLVELQGQMAVIHTEEAIETKEDYIQLAKLLQNLGSKLIENTHRYQDWRSNIKKEVQKAGKKIPS